MTTTTTRYVAAQMHPGDWAVVRVVLNGPTIVSEQVMLRMRSEASALRTAESMTYAHYVAQQVREARAARR